MKTEDGVRPYRMTARADAAAATGERILDAAAALFWELPTDQIVLAEVAARAGVTVQTVIRRFGGKEALLAATVERELARPRRERSVPPDEPELAVAAILDHYEELGPGILRLLAAESTSPVLAEYAERGRQAHRDMCIAMFPSALAGLKGADRGRRLAQLMAVSDVSMWKLLHLDAGLSRRQTHLALLELLRPLLGNPDGGSS